jgi:hypothetical protein
MVLILSGNLDSARLRYRYRERGEREKGGKMKKF